MKAQRRQYLVQPPFGAAHVAGFNERFAPGSVNRLASGYALKQEFKIEGTDSVFVVTNVMKAAFLFKDRERAHYVCLIEVVPPDEVEPDNN